MKQALWNVNSQPGAGKSLGGVVETDTVIVGGGITGLTTAMRLTEAGNQVVVLEARQIGSGDTGNSTGNLYSTLSQGLAPVDKKWSTEVVTTVVAERARAIDSIESIVDRFAIDCQFQRQPLYWCSGVSGDTSDESLQHEHAVAKTAGLEAHLVDAVPRLAHVSGRALRLENQAQFNPLSYVQGLARRIIERGGAIYENSPVTDIDAKAGVIHTAGGEVRARQIVLATHSPIGINLLQAEMEPSREYGIAAVLKKEGQPECYPEGTVWIREDAVSLRSYRYNGQQYLIVVGHKHKTGEGKLGEGYYQTLERYASNHFEVAEFTHRWSAQQFQSADLLPYIGHSGHDNVWVGTGYAADGLVWGAVAGDIIANQITGREDKRSQLFDPHRFTPLKSAGRWTIDNLSVASHFIRGYLTPARVKQLDQVESGEGKIVSVDGDRLAVFRSSANELVALSPVCPHMKCMVNWNGADKTWDCPCHGNRFAVDGQVLEGPAMQPLARHLIDEGSQND